MANPYDPYKAPTAVDTAPVASAPTAVPDSVVQLLGQTRPWVKLMAVLAFVVLGFSLLALLGFYLAAGASKTLTSFLPLLLMGSLYMPAALFLWRYADSIRQVQGGGGQAALESALRNQKSFWKYVGILACVMIALNGVALVGGIIFGLLSGRRGG